MLKRILTFAISLIILLVTIFPQTIMANIELKYTYISEIIASTGSTDTEAKKWLTDKGYTVVNKNLNAGTDEDPVYLGYKTTTNRNDAITDVSLMDMNNGYELMDYEQFAMGLQENIGNMTENLKTACIEMREKLKNGSRAAEIALSYLNIFTVPEAVQNLGDYLIDTKRTEKDYRNILLICNSLVINIIYSQLALGTSDEKGNTWIERLSKEGPDETPRDEDNNDYWEEEYNKYSEDALKILSTLKTFSKSYKEADKRRQEKGGEIVLEGDPEKAKEIVNNITENGKELDDTSGDALVIAAYEYLNQFKYKEDEKLGDTFLKLAEIDPEDEEELTLIYPIVKSLTPAQRYLLTIQGVEVYTTLAISNSETYDELELKREEYANELYEAVGSENASVWMGTNKDLFDSKIALTTKAKRAADAANDYNKLTEVTDFDVDIKAALCYIGAACTATAGITLISLGIGAFIFKGIGATIVCGMMIMGHAISATVCGVAFGCIGVIGIVATFIAVAALIVCAIIYAVDCLIDLYDYYNPEYTDIPQVMVDYEVDSYVTYNAVKGRNGKPFDINVWEGRRWNALYVTKDSSAGSPLILDESGNAFKVIYGSTSVPENTKPVTRFGSIKAVNLNSNTYDDDVNGIYMYFYPESTNSGGTEETEDAVYLESLVLYTHKDGRVVKDKITNDSGYELVDFNLTYDTDYDTYIGFTTTKNPNNAITDIRVSYSGSLDKYYYGDVGDTYGMAGTTSKTIGEEESTGLLVSLYYTKSKNRGTPILADLLVSKNRPDKSLGYEPVNFFSGGDAFNFNHYPEQDSDTWKNHAYIYFKPSVVFNASNSNLYLGGISFVSGSTDMDEGKLSDYIKELGLTASNIDITKGFYDDTDKTLLCYYETYNPYRAIYDIGVYTAEYKSSYLKENIILDGAGFVACQTYTEGDRNYYGNVFWGGHYRLIRPDHAYITKTEDYGGDDEYGDSYVCNRGMYVSGPISGKEPIAMAEFKISTNSTIPEGFVAVHDMTEKYADRALNLAMNDSDNRNNMYIFYKGTAPVKEKYISSISVFFSSEEDYSYDTVMYQLMAAGGDEIIRVNLAGESGDSWNYTNGSACFDDDSDRDDYEDAHAYIRVTRTKTKNSAIGTICLVEGSNGGKGTLTLPVNTTGSTALFTKAGNKITYNENKSYYIYYATVGNKIENLRIDKIAVVHDWITALSENQKLITNAGYYIHSYSSVSLPYYSLVMFHRSNDRLKSISELLAAGCTDVERINKSGDPVYIGWAKTSSTNKSIKNIVVSLSNTYSLDGIDYLCGGSAHGVYIFYTTSGEKSKSITHINVDTKIPTAVGDDLVWEYVQDSDGNIYNMKKVVENNDGKTYRIYLNRKDNKAYNEKSFLAASTLTNINSVAFVVVLCIIPLVPLSALLIYRKVKRNKGKKVEKS